jgi:hypothetical protein
MSAIYLAQDADEFSESYDHSAIPVGTDMTGHDIPLLGPKTVMLDAFIIDLQTVDTSAQTFRLKLLVNMDWEDDGTIEPEVKSVATWGAHPRARHHPGHYHPVLVQARCIKLASTSSRLSIATRMKIIRVVGIHKLY